MSDRQRERELREEEKAAVEQLRELERIQAEADLRAVMSSPAGRRFVWRLIEQRCGLHNGVYSPVHSDMALAEGRRAIGRELLAEVHRVAPPQANQMIHEWSNGWQERQARREMQAQKK
jgi:Ser/Thr protein kinase RdoA (MazF antagonist)